MGDVLYIRGLLVNFLKASMSYVDYLIAEKMGGELYGIRFTQNWNGAGPYVTVWRGARGGPGCSGATVSPAEVLQRYRRYFVMSGAEWFVPLVQRLANGEEVPIDEIKRAFSIHNDGASLPEELCW
jgi:hypothetical protein